MLRISKLTDYASNIMSNLAASGEASVSASELSERLPIGKSSVQKALKMLAKAGLVVSDRGVDGGYRLASDPESISLADIVAAIEGKPALTNCCEAAGICAHESGCGMRGNWMMINSLIVQFLEGVSLKDMSEPLSSQHFKHIKIEEQSHVG